MLTIPPLPAWQAIHPLIIHFPIALLLIAPLFIMIGTMAKPSGSFQFLLAALILMTIGTAGTFLAAASGHAAGELTERIPLAKSILERHENLAETTQLAFSALTLIFAFILFVPRLLKAEPTRLTSSVLPLVFLMLYATGAITLANTAHEGGRLVHEVGVRVRIQSNHFAIESAERD